MRQEYKKNYDRLVELENRIGTLRNQANKDVGGFVAGESAALAPSLVAPVSAPLRMGIGHKRRERNLNKIKGELDELKALSEERNRVWQNMKNINSKVKEIDKQLRSLTSD